MADSTKDEDHDSITSRDEAYELAKEHALAMCVRAFVRAGVLTPVATSCTNGVQKSPQALHRSQPMMHPSRNSGDYEAARAKITQP